MAARLDGRARRTCATPSSACSRTSTSARRTSPRWPASPRFDCQDELDGHVRPLRRQPRHAARRAGRRRHRPRRRRRRRVLRLRRRRPPHRRRRVGWPRRCAPDGWTSWAWPRRRASTSTSPAASAFGALLLRRAPTTTSTRPCDRAWPLWTAVTGTARGTARARPRDGDRRPELRHATSPTSAPTSSRSSARRGDSLRNMAWRDPRDGERTVVARWSTATSARSCLDLKAGRRRRCAAPTGGRRRRARRELPPRHARAARPRDPRCCTRSTRRLVITRVTGFGQTGPYAGAAGLRLDRRVDVRARRAERRARRTAAAAADRADRRGDRSRRRVRHDGRAAQRRRAGGRRQPARERCSRSWGR